MADLSYQGSWLHYRINLTIIILQEIKGLRNGSQSKKEDEIVKLDYKRQCTETG